MTTSLRDPGYWHLWCDDSGTSHVTRREFPELTSRVVAEGAVPILVAALGRAVDGDVQIAVVEAGTIGEWHETPRTQWGAVLAGTFFLEAMDGSRVELVTGELFLAEDGTPHHHDGHHHDGHHHDGRRGHRSGAVGDDDVRLLMVPVRTAAGPDRP